MKRHINLFWGGMFLFVLSLRLSGQEQPNILFILSDDHSVPYLGCYGNPDMTTPNLDRLAAEGIRFNRAYTTAPQCVLSRAAIMTGRSTLDVRMTRFTAPLHRDYTAYPEVLRDLGYYTGICGRTFHLDGNHGRSTPVVCRVMEEYDLMTFRDRVDFLRSDNRTRQEDFEEFLDQVPPGKPFFIQVNFSDPHRAFTAPEYAPDPEGLTMPGNLPDETFIREDLAQHIGEINRLDENVGRLLTGLEERDLRENTLVVFMGDNGAALLRGKGTLFECGLNVPLIASWPGHGPGGLVSGALVSGEDIGPTFIDAAGGEVPEYMTGVSCLASFRGEPHEGHEYVFAVRGAHASGPPVSTVSFDLSRTIIGQRYKLIYRCLWQLPYEPADIFKSTDWWDEYKAMAQRGEVAEPWMSLFFSPQRPMYDLYDLQEDPFEFHNLAGDPAYGEIELELKSKLIEWMILNQDYLPLPLIPGDPEADVRRFM